jgi:hypothetical protein
MLNFKGKVLLMVLTLTYLSDVGAQNLQREAGKVSCDEEVKICNYLTQNVTGRDLIAKLNANLFPGSILSPNEGFIVSDGIKKINFYINNEEVKAKFIAAIPLLDTLEDFDPSDLVMLTTDIYSLTEGGLSNIQASLVSANEPTSELSEWAVSSVFTSASGLAIKIGTNLLSSLLGSSKVKLETVKVTTINQLIPNQSGINYSNTSKVYISPAASGVVKEETAGLTIGGTVSISSRDSDLVLIKDYNLAYGVVENITSGERVNILSVNNPQLYLVKGTSSLIVSSITSDKSTRSEYSALSFGKKKDKNLNKVMIVTRAEAVNFKDFVADMKKIRKLDLHSEFTAEEKSQFSTSLIELKDVLSHIIPIAYFTTSGERILGIRLDVQDARLNNISKNIEISVKSGGMFSHGIKQNVILPLESLMLSGLKFAPLSQSDLTKTSIKIEVSLKLFNSKEKVTKTLFYNPETNKFIE